MVAAGARQAGFPVGRALAYVLVAASGSARWATAAHAPYHHPPPTSAAESHFNNPWQLTFADDFDGTSLNTSVWRVAAHPNTNGTWDPSAVHVGGGHLTITTTLKYTAGGVLNASQGHINSSTISRSGLGFAQKHGWFEVRAKVPGATGISPAFWMMPDSEVCWPLGGEIDVFETTCTVSPLQLRASI